VPPRLMSYFSPEPLPVTAITSRTDRKNFVSLISTTSTNEEESRTVHVYSGKHPI
jgi:hypothetical protein